MFGPELWLAIRVDKPISTACYVPSMVEPSLPEQSLTNTNLLMSIGFIPGDQSSTKSTSIELPPVFAEPSSQTELNSFSIVDPAQFQQQQQMSEDVPTEDLLLQTFDVVETPGSVHSLASNDSLCQIPQQFSCIEGQCVCVKNNHLLCVYTIWYV